MGRHGIGVELDPGYYRWAARRLAVEAVGLFRRVELRVEEAEALGVPVLQDHASAMPPPAVAGKPVNYRGVRRRGKASSPGS